MRHNITEGPIAGAVLRLALPVVAGMFMEFALTVTDYFWVGKLGSTAQDAVTTSMIVIWTMFALMTVVTVGITALVARHVGAGNSTQAAFYSQQGLALAAGGGIIAGIVGYLLAPSFIAFMGTSSETTTFAIPYMRVALVTAPMFFIVETIYAVFRAAGDTRTPTMIGVAIIIINLGLDPLLIFGWGPVPALGVTGAAVASGISVAVGVVWIWTKLVHGDAGFALPSLRQYALDTRASLKIVRIGLPIATQQFVFVAVYWILIKIVHEFGEAAAAGMGIGNRMESFSYLTCMGFSVAASTLVGQNLGAGKPERAERCAWGATGLAISVTLIMTILFLTIPRQIAGIFTNDPEALAVASDYLVILGLSQATMAIEIVIEGAFGGAGDTMPPMIVMIPGALVRIPLAYLLAFTLGWGINGVWWSLTITTTIKALVLAFWFYRGRWKLKEV